MNEYDVTITETLEKTVTVNAENAEAAQQLVEAAYRNSEYILGADDFSSVSFDEVQEREKELSQNQIDVLLIKPGQYPEPIKISNDLESLQKAVHGYIETSYISDDPIVLIVNEEGKINGSELNRGLFDDDGELIDIVAGDFLVVGSGEEDFESLPPNLMDKYEKIFHQPETFVRLGKSIMAVPISDEQVKKMQEAADRSATKISKETPSQDAR